MGATMTAAPVFAQENGRFALGGNFGVRTATDSSAAGAKGVGLLWRFGQSHEGWGWHYGLGWYGTDVSWDIANQKAELGRLGVKPIVGGYGYTHVMGKTSVTGNVLGGYAFTSLRQDDTFADSVLARLGGSTVAIDASNTFVVRPGVSAWYNVNEKIGINVSGNYMMARPKVTVTSSGGTDVRRLQADMFTIKVGLVYSLF